MLLAGCGTESTPAESAPELAEGLERVDAAIVDGKDPAARDAVRALVADTQEALAAGEAVTCAVRLKVKDTPHLRMSALGMTSSKEDVVTNNKSVVRLTALPSAAALRAQALQALWMTRR